MCRPLEELRAAVAGEGDEAPEDERVGEPDERLLGDDLRLEHHLAEEPRGAGRHVGRSEARRGPCAPAGGACTTCAAKRPPNSTTSRASVSGGDHYRWSSLTSAGTTSNRSPTMP